MFESCQEEEAIINIAIMQPYFMPYIGYWQLIKAVDKFVIYDDVNYIKGGWINRNRILMNGQAQFINIQLSKSSPNKLINQIEISDNYLFKCKLIKTLETYYRKAPFYNEAFPIVEKIIKTDENNLAKYLESSIYTICEYLAIHTEFIVSSAFEKDENSKGQEKVIDICKRLNASIYINSIGGKELYSKEEFSKYNIILQFLKTNDIIYNQYGNEFIPNLSIIDVMMFNSKKEIKDLLDDCEFI